MINKLLPTVLTCLAMLGAREALAQTLSDPLPKGAITVVVSVAPGGPADKAGLKTGDVIVNFDGMDVPDMRSLPRIVALSTIGRTVNVNILRNGKPQTVGVAVDRLVELATKEAEPGFGNGAAPKDKPGADLPPADQAPGDKTPGPAASDGDVVENALLGLKLQTLNAALRGKLSIAEKVQGVLVTGLMPKGVAPSMAYQRAT